MSDQFPKSQALFTKFLETYTPQFTEEVQTLVSEYLNTSEKLLSIATQIYSEDITVRERKKLYTEKTALSKIQWELYKEITLKDHYFDSKRNPSLIYNDMVALVSQNRIKYIEDHYNSGYFGNLISDIEFLEGKRHATSMIAIWSLLGEEFADSLYKSILLESGFTLEWGKERLEILKKLKKEEPSYDPHFLT